jgi:valyl-tRNA synthetase
LALLDKYGADGVRFGLMSSAAAGGDLIFDAPFGPDGSILDESVLCEQGRNFSNKMWNALRLVKGWNTVDAPESDEIRQKNELAIQWINEKFNQTVLSVESDFTQFRLSEALKSLYAFIWDDFCSSYLEMIKPGYEQPIDRPTYTATLDIFSKMLVALHPFMPFITEELWHQLEERTAGDDCCVQSYPTTSTPNTDLIYQVDTLRDIITKIRDLRNANHLKQKDLLAVSAQNSATAKALFDAKSFISGTDKFYVEMPNEIDVAAEIIKITTELEYQRGFARSVEGKLSNEKFVSSAPKQVVDNERKKLSDSQARIAILEESLAKLS